MVEAIQERSKSSMYGAQPRSLNINWMKYNVTNENVCPNTGAHNAKQLSPLRLKLQQKGEDVLNKRQMLTQAQIENRISEANLRREHASVDAQIRRISPRMQRSQNQHSRTAYLSEMALKRHQYEEAIHSEYEQNIKRIEASQTRQSMIAEADEHSERDESVNGLQNVA